MPLERGFSVAAGAAAMPVMTSDNVSIATGIGPVSAPMTEGWALRGVQIAGQSLLMLAVLRRGAAIVAK